MANEKQISINLSKLWNWSTFTIDTCKDKGRKPETLKKLHLLQYIPPFFPCFYHLFPNYSSFTCMELQGHWTTQAHTNSSCYFLVMEGSNLHFCLSIHTPISTLCPSFFITNPILVSTIIQSNSHSPKLPPLQRCTGITQKEHFRISYVHEGVKKIQ